MNLNKKSVLLGAAAIGFVLSTSLAFASSSSALLPQSDGAFTQWTPSTGASHFALVDEAVCNGSTDFNSTTVVGNRDSYGVDVSSVPNGAVITKVEIKPCASRVTGGGTNPVMKLFYSFGGTNSADAGSYSLTGTTPTELASTSFNGVSLLKTSTSTLEVGAVLTSSTKGAKLSRIATILTYTALLAPTSLSTSSTTASSTLLKWTDNSTSTEQGTAVEISTDNINWSGLATTSVGVATYNVNGLTPATNYYFRTRAYNFGGYSSYSNTSTTTTLDVPPAAPSALSLSTALNASSTAMDITLNWTDNSSNETGFLVERSIGTSSFVQIATTSANVVSFVDTNKTTGTYTYQVRAFNSGGKSAYSNTASTSFTVVPAAPTVLTATTLSSSTIRINWRDNATSTETGTAIEISIDAINWSGLATTSPGVHPYTSIGLTPSTTYFYRVRSFNSAGYSSYSNNASATTLDVPPSAPTGLSLATSTNASSTIDIVLNWTDNSSNEQGFLVERSLGGVFSHFATTSINAITITDFNHATGTYAYRLRAFNVVGKSVYSNTATTTLP